ncbi:MAG: hypothetical protein QM621_11700 [Aeromicrobium sp.]|uniref:hypothetical protein n=1 Tax=Aeromicrobium sp. TaxID=1871063 RepID=UPI0039E72509
MGRIERGARSFLSFIGALLFFIGTFVALAAVGTFAMLLSRGELGDYWWWMPPVAIVFMVAGWIVANISGYGLWRSFMNFLED